jgi:hypothetical protein
MYMYAATALDAIVRVDQELAEARVLTSVNG